MISSPVMGPREYRYSASGELAAVGRLAEGVALRRRRALPAPPAPAHPRELGRGVRGGRARVPRARPRAPERQPGIRVSGLLRHEDPPRLDGAGTGPRADP